MAEASNKKPAQIIPAGFFTRINLYLVVFFIVIVLLGQLFLFWFTRSFLEFHYSGVLLKLTQLKQELLLTSLIVNGLFFVIPCVFAVLFLIVYSHRVAGPMYHVKLYLRNPASDKKALSFRKTDVMHSLATAVNAVQERERNDAQHLLQGLDLLPPLLAQAQSEEVTEAQLSELLAEVEQLTRAQQERLDRVQI